MKEIELLEEAKKELSRIGKVMNDFNISYGVSIVSYQKLWQVSLK